MRAATITTALMILLPGSVLADQQPTPLTPKESTPQQSPATEVSARWVEPISFNSADVCVDPMIQMRGEYTIGQEGLDGIIGFFVEADLNKDKKVCIDEIQQVSPDSISVWAAYDRNGDQCITPAEARESLEAIMLAQWVKDFNSIDGNRNGRIEPHELENRFGSPKPGTMSPKEIMEEYDLDFDGFVTRLEYVQRSVMALREIRAANPKLAGLKTKPLPPATGPRYLKSDPLDKKKVDQQ